MKKILMILTSHERMENTDSKTGLWLGEFTDPYYEFIDAGYDVRLASPLGGKPPIDPMSTLTKNITDSNRRFQDDKTAQDRFNNTMELTKINKTDDDALFYPGGHGPLWDLANNNTSGQLIIDFLTNNKPVAAICHGPAALIKAAEIKPDLLKGKKLTAFTNTEEKMVLRSNNIPFELESRLKELGADFSSAAIPFTSHVEEEGILITGQNPASAKMAAKVLIKMLEGVVL